MTNNSAQWLTNQGKTLSPFGEQVADILGIVYRGIYHIGADVLHRQTVWDSDVWIEVKVAGSIATYDGDELSKLVILCHDRCIRLEISPSYQKLALCFSPSAREGMFYERQPTIEQAIETTRKCAS